MSASIVASFENHIDSIKKLMNFDRDVLDLAINNIRNLRDTLADKHGITNPQLAAVNTLLTLERIREHDSLRTRYETIFNQALVLLISYFSSTVHDLFLEAVSNALDSGANTPFLDKKIEFSPKELKDSNFQVKDLIPSMVASGISFQDMQSITRAFKANFDVQLDKSTNTNNIICGQACRHAIVHAGGLADAKLLHQISGAVPRTIKENIALNEKIQFSPSEVEQIGRSMLWYIKGLDELLTGHQVKT
jgi:hypothetical protein